MKNSDKIKELEHELGRYMQKVGDQAQEIAQLKADAKGYQELLNLQSAIINTLMVRAKRGKAKIIIPVAEVTENLKYTARKVEENGNYIIEVVKNNGN